VNPGSQESYSLVEKREKRQEKLKSWDKEQIGSSCKNLPLVFSVLQPDVLSYQM
jgi:hypothetical protein